VKSRNIYEGETISAESHLVVVVEGVEQPGVVHGPLPLVGQDCTIQRIRSIRNLALRKTNGKDCCPLPEYASWIRWNRCLASPVAPGSLAHRSGCHFCAAGEEHNMSTSVPHTRSKTEKRNAYAMRDEKQRTGTYHGEPSVGGAYVGGGGVLADAEHGIIAAGRRAGAGGIAGSGSGGGVHGSRAGQPSVDEVTRQRGK
jgi:hypothetical protein